MRGIGSGDNEPLGLLYLATCAREHGYDVRVCSFGSSPWTGLWQKIQATKPQIVGFYCDHDNVTSVCRISILLKRAMPSLVLLVGGPQATSAAEGIMTAGCFDALVRGEGEHAFVELMDYFVRGTGVLGEILGVVYWIGKKLVSTPARPPNRQLDDLPFPDRFLSDDRLDSHGDERIISGRGCPFHCAFCAEGSAESSVYHYRSARSVLAEVDELLATRKLRYLLFMDDTFVAKVSRAREIARGLQCRREQGADFCWYCEARVDILCKHPDLLQTMRQAGLARVQIGIESGDQKILDAYGKGVTVDQIRRAVGLAVEAGVPSIVGNFIIGGAHETADSLARSLDFAQELIELAPGRIDLTTTYLTPYPGTAIRLQPREYGVRIDDAECLTGQDDRYPFVQTDELDKWHILDAHERFHAVRQGVMFRVLQERMVADSLAVEHFRLYERHGLLTQWMQLYLSIGHLSNFYGLLLGDDCCRQAQIAPDELPLWYPVRTHPLAASQRGGLVVRPFDQLLRFDALGTAIYELCSGRSPLGRICALIRQRFFPNEPEHHVLALLRAFMERLEEQRLLVWSRV